ncbi:hypothetical protein D3C87_1956670 [compost metagenome]
MRQKCILLTLIETMNFINEENGATTRIAILPGTFDSLADLFHTRSDGRQTFDVGVSIASNHFSQRGLACPRRPP